MKGQRDDDANAAAVDLCVWGKMSESKNLKHYVESRSSILHHFAATSQLDGEMDGWKLLTKARDLHKLYLLLESQLNLFRR